MRIFNQIRKVLLKNGQLKDYTKYAIGEIILVVIGILIALQINNLNEVSKTNESKRVVTEIINESFHKNDQAIKVTLQDCHTIRKITDLRILNTGPKIGIPKQAIIDSIRILDLLNLKLANNLQSNILIDNSSLSLLDADIRILLLEFTTLYKEYKIIETNINNIVLKLRENHQSHISLLTENTTENTLDVLDHNLFSSNYLNWLRDPINQNISVEIKWKIERAIAALIKLEEMNIKILENTRSSKN